VGQHYLWRQADLKAGQRMGALAVELWDCGAEASTRAPDLSLLEDVSVLQAYSEVNGSDRGSGILPGRAHPEEVLL
jgi:hypothetical protein